MWNLQLEKLEAFLKPEGGLPRIAIETGTCRGNGTRKLAERFGRVYTIELSAQLSDEARHRLSGPEFAHVRFIQGNSAEALPTILSAIQAEMSLENPSENPSKKPAKLACGKIESPAVFFFLDAHWSGDRSVDWTHSRWKGYGIDTAHLADPGVRPTGAEQCPLYEELAMIVQHCRGPAYILIDDLKNLPAEGVGLVDHEFLGEDWSHLSRAKLLKIVQPRLRRQIELENPAQWFLILDEAPLTNGDDF